MKIYDDAPYLVALKVHLRNLVKKKLVARKIKDDVPQEYDSIKRYILSKPKQLEVQQLSWSDFSYVS